ncbi:MAG: adenine deaminase [Pseudomonadota bacterium]
MQLADLIAAANGKRPVDLLLKNGRLVNVLSGEIHHASVAIAEDLVVGFGDYDATEVLDLEGRYIVPGFIDGHVHIESSMLDPAQFARNVAPLGTTSVVADPHEIANVLGVEGVRYMLEASRHLPVRVFIMFPSCVPATPFETSGAEILHGDMVGLKDHERVPGLAEVMNFPGLVAGDEELIKKVTLFSDKVIDGHAPGASGKFLCAYVAAGVGSDHECTGIDEAREKLRLGMRVMIREGSAAKNMDALLPLVNEHNSRNCFFVTDDMDPRDILEQGHINRILRKAISKGLDPLRAVQMATINTARYFGLKKLGAVRPGYFADLLVLENLEEIIIDRVYQGGRLTAVNGKIIVDCPSIPSDGVTRTINVDWAKASDLSIAAQGDMVNVIQVVPGEIVTKRIVEKTPRSDGLVVSDPSRDILKIAVIERHRATGRHAVGLIKGFGLKRGAMAGTVAHDSHNIIVIGVNDRDMLVAAKEAANMGGGLVAAADGAVLERLALPIAGLMSDRPLEEVTTGLGRLIRCVHDMGCPLEAPFATMSFMALTPIPELKMTDMGLFDSVNFRFTSLFEGE